MAGFYFAGGRIFSNFALTENFAVFWEGAGIVGIQPLFIFLHFFYTPTKQKPLKIRRLTGVFRSATGIRTRISALRGPRTKPLFDSAMGFGTANVSQSLESTKIIPKNFSDFFASSPESASKRCHFAALRQRA